MAKTQTSCPSCRQPVLAEVEQLFDMSVDSQAKQKLLSGAFNLIRCPHCGFQGSLSTPIVYHDPEKELLITFFPADLGLSMMEQEKLVGPLLQKVMQNMPQEKRRGYLFKPQQVLTMQLMVEKILEADGISKEMLEAQQNRIKFIEQLITAQIDARKELIKQNEALIDQDFFALLNRLIEATTMQGDQQGAQSLVEIQKLLFAETKLGKELEQKAKETNDAIKSLQEAGKNGLTREKLLNLIIEAESETRLRVLVSLARSGLDYGFFELLTQRINNADESGKAKLIQLRDQLLEITQEIDLALKNEINRAHSDLQKVLNADDVEKAFQGIINRVDDFFIEAVNEVFAKAEKDADEEKLRKIIKIQEIITSLTAPPPEVKIIEELVTTTNDAELEQALEKHSETINSEFLQMFNNLVMQYEQQNQPQEVMQKLKDIYNKTLQHLMKKNLSKTTT